MTDKRDKRTSFHFDETKNMFYEQEITKQKQEMSELRSASFATINFIALKECSQTVGVKIS